MLISLCFSKVGVGSQAFAQGWTYTLEDTKKILDIVEHYFTVDMRFCIYKGISNQLNSFVRLLHLYCCFQKHPYCPPLIPYSHMAIWPYDHISAILPYSHMGIWPNMASTWVTPETAIKMQHSGEGIKLI
jgi:hypothetical protein